MALIFEYICVSVIKGAFWVNPLLIERKSNHSSRCQYWEKRILVWEYLSRHTGYRLLFAQGKSTKVQKAHHIKPPIKNPKMAGQSRDLEIWVLEWHFGCNGLQTSDTFISQLEYWKPKKCSQIMIIIEEKLIQSVSQKTNLKNPPLKTLTGFNMSWFIIGAVHILCNAKIANF